MNLVPFRRANGGTLRRLHDEMDGLFNRFFDWDPQAGDRGWMPALDLAEREDALVVKAELPGMSKDDIDISVQGNVLTISGEKKDSTEEKKDEYYHVERRHGYFRRDITLSSEVDAEKIEATYHDGVLTVTLPKSEQAKPRRIEVKNS